jgi:hypothetical protein
LRAHLLLGFAHLGSKLRADIPALNRLGIGPVGAFSVYFGPETPAYYLLMPSSKLETLVKSSASNSWRISISTLPSPSEVGQRFDPVDGFLAGIDLDQGEAGDEFLGFSERTVDDSGFAGGEFDAGAFGTGLETFASEKNPRFAHFSHVIVHFCEDSLAGQGACPCGIVGFTYQHESH